MNFVDATYSVYLAKEVHLTQGQKEKYFKMCS